MKKTTNAVLLTTLSIFTAVAGVVLISAFPMVLLFLKDVLTGLATIFLFAVATKYIFKFWKEKL